MTVKRIFKTVAGFLAAACMALAFVVLDAGALSQNTNSSTTTQEDEANANANHSAHKTPRRRRGRRGRRPARTAPAVETMPSETTEGTGQEEPSPRPEVVINRGTMPAPENTSGGTQEDLSGTFTGRMTMTGGHEMSGQGTLTITGNTFTLEAEGMAHSGRIYAVNTRRYIGAALYFPDVTDTATNTPLAVSVRARRQGNSLSLTPVPGSRNKLTFRGRSN